MLVILGGCATQGRPQPEASLLPTAAFEVASPEYPDVLIGRIPQWYQELESGGEVVIDNPFGDVYVRHNRGGSRVGISGVVQRLGKDQPTERLALRAAPGRVALEVDFPGAPDKLGVYGRPGRVDLTVLVPAGSTLRIRTRDGNATGKRVQANLDVQSDAGRIDFSTTGWAKARSSSGDISLVLIGEGGGRSVELDSERGALRMEVPVLAAATFDIDAPAGLSAEPAALLAQLRKQGEGAWRGTWARPGQDPNHLKLRTRAGQVRLYHYGTAAEFEQAQAGRR